MAQNEIPGGHFHAPHQILKQPTVLLERDFGVGRVHGADGLPCLVFHVLRPPHQLADGVGFLALGTLLGLLGIVPEGGAAVDALVDGARSPQGRERRPVLLTRLANALEEVLPLEHGTALLLRVDLEVVAVVVGDFLAFLDGASGADHAEVAVVVISEG